MDRRLLSGSDNSIQPTRQYYMMTSSNGNIFRVTGPLCREFTGYQWIPLTKANERGALMFSLICAWINGWVINREAGDLRRHRPHCDVTIMSWYFVPSSLYLHWTSRVPFYLQDTTFYVLRLWLPVVARDVLWIGFIFISIKMIDHYNRQYIWHNCFDNDRINM